MVVMVCCGSLLTYLHLEQMKYDEKLNGDWIASIYGEHQTSIDIGQGF